LTIDIELFKKNTHYFNCTLFSFNSLCKHRYYFYGCLVYHTDRPPMCFDVYSALMSSVEADIQTDIQILLKLPTSAMPLCTTTIENFPPKTP